MTKHIPNLLTCLNLFFGCVALVCIFQNQLIEASYFVLLSGICDFFDGFAARLLKAHSTIGKDLDSLADMVSFGVVPGAMLFMLLRSSLPQDQAYLAYGGFIITIFSALRLAKFNNDERQSDKFVGINTPMNTFLIVSLPHLMLMRPTISTLTWSVVLGGLIVLMSYLLIAEISFIAIKFKGKDWQTNRYKYILILVSAVLIILIKFAAVPLILIVYFILSYLQFRSSDEVSS